MPAAVEFSHILASGRFDATLGQAQSAWDDYRERADLITATEYGSGKFDAALVADGWDHFRGKGEGVVSWRTDVFELAWKHAGYADRIGSPFFRGGNQHAQTPLTCVPLRHKPTGRIVMVRVCHMPAHVQAGDGFRKTTARVIAQGRAWLTSLAVWAKRSRRFADHHPGSVEINTGDFNVDLHRAHWRTVLQALGQCAMPLTKLGDLGKRLVSWAFVRGLEVISTAILPAHPGFDHHPVLICYAIKEK